MTRSTNPIQQVLAAERAAEEAIEAARGEAETAVSEYRRSVPHTLRRNEARTQRAVERYERKQAQRRAAAAGALRAQVAAELAQEKVLLEEEFAHIVDDIFNEFWPRNGTD